MKHLIVSMCLALLLVTALSAQAEITFKDTSVDFGEIESGKVADLAFEFENTGNEMLIIKNISSTCGCTVTRLEKKEYKPGEKGSIPVKFYSRGYQGRVIKSITVSSNDKRNHYIRLKISGIVVLKDFAAIAVVPNRLKFADIPLGKEAEKIFVIKNTGTQTLRIIELVHSPEISPVFTEKSIAPGKQIQVTLRLNPMSEGPLVTFLKIRSNAFRQTISLLKISAKVVSEAETAE